LEALPKVREKAEVRVKLIEVVKAERAAFEQKGRIPFSARMRFAAKIYLKAGTDNRVKLSRAFDRAIDFHLKQKDTTKAREYTARKQGAVKELPVAIWSRRVANRPAGNAILYSNGRIGSPNSPNKWAWDVKRHVLTFRWPDPKAPGREWVDSHTLTADGR